jgi:hypothetical protein
MQELTKEVVNAWGDDSVLAVGAEHSDTAQTIAADAMAVLRFYMRDLIRVNVEIHLIGMVGEIRSGSREFVLLTDTTPPQAAPGWSRIGGTIDFTFTDESIDTLSAREALTYLGQWLSAASIEGADPAAGSGRVDTPAPTTEPETHGQPKPDAGA